MPERGGVLTFLTDSAGGTIVFADAAERLKRAMAEMPGEGGISTVDWPNAIAVFERPKESRRD
jgi:hypothetical protein